MTASNLDLHQVAATLLRYPACLIATHINPEGDAIGSMLALAMALEQRGVTVYCYDRDGVPANNRFLPGWECVQTALPTELPPLLIYVDADRPERCNLTLAEMPGIESIVRIDHHVGPEAHLGPAMVDTTAAATGELIFQLLPYLEATLTPEIATCLHTALMVDTGRFSYTNTTARTLQIAAALVEAGAEVELIVEWVWGRMRFAATRLTGLALATAQLAANGHIAWAVLQHEDFLATAAAPEDTEGIIDHLRSIEGVDVAALFSEKRGVVRVSLRSRGRVDVAALARSFQGGGHVKAAGLTYDGPLPYAIADVLRAIEAALGE